MKSSFKRGVGLGVFGVASALALGGVVVLPATAEEGAVAPTDGAAFDELAAEFFQDDSVTGVLYNEAGDIIVQQLQSGAAVESGTASARVDAGAAAAQLADKYSNVTIVPVSEEDVAKPASATDVVGGAGILLLDSANQSGGYCSVGFPAWTPDGDPAIITAGHCTDDGAYPNVYLLDPSGEPAGGGADDGSDSIVTADIGQVTVSQFGGTGNTAGSTAQNDAIDFTAVDVSNDALSLHPAMTDWQDTSDLFSSLATNITSVGEAEWGAGPIARSGRTTGYSEGELTTDVDQYLAYKGYLDVEGRLVKGFATAQQVIPGDSGGTMVQGSTAVGVVTGYMTLEDTSGNQYDYTWGANIEDGLAISGGYSVLLDLQEPALGNVQSGANIAWSADLTGTAGAGNTVEYAFAQQGEDADWSQSATTSVGSDGAFGFTGPTVPGDYTIYLRANDGGYNTSDVVSYDVQVFPTAPVIVTPENGSSTTDNVTAIAGTASPNADVALSGSVEAAVTADADGNWTYATDLGIGDYTVKASQTVAGKTSDAAEVSFSVVAAKPAAPEIIAPVAGGSYENTVGNVTGTGVEGAKIELQVDGSAAGEATVAGGVWQIASGNLSAGEHTFTARQFVDGAASDWTTVTVTITVPAETPAPTEPNESTPTPTPTQTDQSTPAPTTPGDNGNKLTPTGGEFNAALPLGLAGGLVLAAGAVILIVRARQVRSER